ncbi:hypothetical protein [Paenarthrobacter nicotinovorans]|nr:hypothetical protein [Paenarthrobacter nicotinovorans]MBP2396839.1 hypothetical protein [Paenarthrobacter nicotinovorans]
MTSIPAHSVKTRRPATWAVEAVILLLLILAAVNSAPSDLFARPAPVPAVGPAVGQPPDAITRLLDGPRELWRFRPRSATGW